MTLLPFALADENWNNENSRLAEDLRRIASELESGDIQQVILTAIRRDGKVERLSESSFPIVRS